MDPSSLPRTLPAVFSDRVNLAAHVVYVPEIHFIMDLDNALDPARLKQAIRLLLDAEPVLGCRFVSHWLRPKWERLDGPALDRAETLETVAGSREVLDRAQARFLDGRIDAATGPQLQALWLEGEAGGRLVVKINHGVCDAGGFKEALYTLAKIYRKLETDPGFTPETRAGRRGLWQVYGRFSLWAVFKLYLQGLGQMLRSVIPFRTQQVDGGKEVSGSLAYVFRQLSPDRGKIIAQYAAGRGATVNDVFVAAVIRAMARHTRWEGKRALRLVGTVDLRRYLPGRRAEALCQVSGMLPVHLGRDLGDSLEETLDRVRFQTEEQKRNNIGLPLMALLRMMYLGYPWFLFRRAMAAFWRLGIRDGNLPAGFTNMGSLDSDALDLGLGPARKAFLAIPAVMPPWAGWGLSGFNGGFTLSAGFYPSALSKERVEDFFDLVEGELPV